MRTVPFLRRVPADTLLFLSCVALAFGSGSLAGTVAGLAFVHDVPPAIVRGSGASVTTVVFEGFRDGALRGQAAGPLRLFARDERVDVAADGRFSIVHPAFRIEEVSVPVPPGMRFVASKNGKKYYKVDSAAGERIAPQNRVYFADETAAAAAGFRP